MSNLISYNKSTIYGESTCDYLWIYNDIASSALVESSKIYNYEPNWLNPTTLLALFNNSLNAGNVEGLEENIISWLIYRQEPTSTALKFIAELPVSTNNIIDYNIKNNKSYKYVIFPVTELMIGLQLEADNYTTANWSDWSLLQLEKSDIDNLYYADIKNNWSLQLNLESGNLVHTIEKFQVNNFLQYPTINTGKRNYSTNNIKCLLGKYENDLYEDTIERQKQFRAFIKSNSLKFLRDIKGNSFLVETIGNNFKYHDEVEQQLTTIDFNFIEIESLEEMNIIEK